uniref:Uncharacterized protein n=1 Tax=Plectus sambesii TaxID=2011161 RepID=A0A914X9A5_9BILA
MLIKANKTFALTNYKWAQGSDEQHLLSSLFSNYNKNLRPVINAAEVVNVTVEPSPFNIVETDEASDSITIVLWFYMEWKDEFLHWNSSEFGGMEELLVPSSDIWYPDVIVYNTISIQSHLPEIKNYVLIASDGTMYLTLSQILTMRCQYHIIMFPFDIQTCKVKLGSWVHSMDEIDIFYTTPNADRGSYNENPAWELISMPATKSTVLNGDTTQVIIDYDIVIQRKPIYYLLTFILPCFMITTISIVGVFSPFNDVGDREEKVTMGLTTLLTMTLVLTLIADKMPKSSEGLSLLGTYVLLQIVIAAVTTLISVVIMYQSRSWAFGKPVNVLINIQPPWAANLPWSRGASFILCTR